MLSVISINSKEQGLLYHFRFNIHSGPFIAHKTELKHSVLGTALERAHLL